MSLSSSAHVNAAITEIPTRISGSVDELEVSARLEMSGYGDRFSQSLGYRSVFDHAQVVWGYSQIPQDRVEIAGSFGEALKRSVFVLAGIVLCLAVVGHDPVAVGLTGASAWVNSIVVGSVLWWGLGRGNREWGSRVALASGMAVIALAAVSAAATHDLGVVAAAMWGCIAGIGMVGGVPRSRVMLVILSAAIALLGHALPGSQWDVIPGLITIGLLFALAVRDEWPRARAPRAPQGAAATAVAWLATLQVVAQIVALLAILRNVQSDALLVLVAALALTAVAEPLLAFAKLAVRFATARLAVITPAQVATGGVGFAWTASLMVVGMGAAGAASLLWQQQVGPTTVLSVLAMCGLVSGVTVMLGTGSQLGAVVVSIGAALAFWALTWTVPYAPWVLAALAVPGSLALGARRLAHPGTW